MADDLLTRIQREIRERKEAARAAYDESRSLEAALAALTPDGARTEPERAVTRSRRTGAGSRAPRGENRQRILDAVADRPGASAGQIAEVTGIKRATAASTLAKLVRDGALARVELPGGRVGFKALERPADLDGTRRQARTAGLDETPGGDADAPTETE